MRNFYFLIFLVFTACQNPLQPIAGDIADFKKQYGDHLVTYQGKHHPMHLAWSGNVKKPPLIFVHGSPGSWEVWARFLMDEELQKNFHLIAVDRPGFGGSDPGKTEISLEIQAQEIVEALKFNKSRKKAIAIGHSYGGAVIARMAMDRPDLISGLIFVASSVDPQLEEPRWYNLFLNKWPMSKWLPPMWRVSNEEILAFGPELEKIKWDKVKAKVALIQGEEDWLVPPSNYVFLIRTLTPGQITQRSLVPKQGHFILWKKPEYVFQGIESLRSTQRFK